MTERPPVSKFAPWLEGGYPKRAEARP